MVHLIQISRHHKTLLTVLVGALLFSLPIFADDAGAFSKKDEPEKSTEENSKPRLGTYKKPRAEHPQHQQQYGYGAPSFGLNTSPQHHHYPKEVIIYPSPTYTPRHGIEYVTPRTIYRSTHQSGNYSSPSVITGLDRRTYANKHSRNSEINAFDPWQALSNYEISTALDLFAWQIDDRPYAALPQVGYALSLALAGETKEARENMRLALAGNVTELYYFRSDTELNLVLEEILLSYRNDALMTTTIRYLQQDFIAANESVEEALSDCRRCASARHLKELLARHQ